MPSFNRLRKRNRPQADIETLPLRNWPTLPSERPDVSNGKRLGRFQIHNLAKPKQAVTRHQPAEHKTPIRSIRSKIEKNMAWQHGSLRGKSRLQSSVSTVPENVSQSRTKLKISLPIVHPNMMQHIMEIHHLGERKKRQEAKRISEATFRFAAQYKAPQIPPSPSYNGGPFRRSITSPIVFSPTLSRFSKVKSRSSVLTWFRQHPGEKVVV